MTRSLHWFTWKVQQSCNSWSMYQHRQIELYCHPSMVASAFVAYLAQIASMAPQFVSRGGLHTANWALATPKWHPIIIHGLCGSNRTQTTTNLSPFLYDSRYWVQINLYEVPSSWDNTRDIEGVYIQTYLSSAWRCQLPRCQLRFHPVSSSLTGLTLLSLERLG